MIICEHCLEAIASRGEKFAQQELSEKQLQKARTDEDGLSWLVCEWCDEENTVDELAEVAFD